MSSKDTPSFEVDSGFGDFSMGGGFDPSAMNMGPPDRCTQCSMCVMSCPTYQITGDFDQSPMGRIKIMRENPADVSDEQKAALESCLHCFNCENICPSRVEYRRLIVDAYEKLGLPRASNRGIEWLKKLSVKRAQNAPLVRIARIIAPIGAAAAPLLAPIQRNFLKRLAKSKSIRTNHADKTDTLLFIGCTSELIDSRTVDDAQHLLESLIGAPCTITNQCCGALSRHSGDKSQANTLARKNLDAFSNEALQRIVTLSSACYDSLRHYDQWLSDEGIDTATTQSLGRKLIDIIGLLSTLAWEPSTQAEKPLKLMLHTPCSARRSESTGQLLELLGKIPNIESKLIQSPYACCGAGGTHSLTHEGLAAEALAPLLQDVANWRPDVILSTNSSCAMHMESHFANYHIDAEIMHPVSFLRQYSA